MSAQASTTSPRRRSIWGQTAQVLMELVYPAQCAVCRHEISTSADGIALCDGCRGGLAPTVGGWCLRCSAPLVSSDEPLHDCPHCKQEKFQWEAAVALGRYQGELSRAVVRMKSPRAEAITIALARLLLAERGEALARLRAELVIPMPMHWARRLARGVNGPELIAEVLARGLELPLKIRGLRRRRLTALQTEVGRQERHVNQRRSFRVPKAVQVAGRRILLVDDVLTTGATAHEAAKALCEAGAEAVFVAAIARGVGEDAL